MSEVNDGVSEPDYSQLYVLAGDIGPGHITDMTVYDSIKREVLSHPAQFNIIGSSHYVSIPGLGYREVSSCRPIDHPDVHHYDLTDRPSTRLHASARHGFEVEIWVDTYPVDEFDPDDDYDLAYKFEGDGLPDAWTTIDVGPHYWETWHTYPEYDVALWTNTTLYPRVTDE